MLVYEAILKVLFCIKNILFINQKIGYGNMVNAKAIKPQWSLALFQIKIRVFVFITDVMETPNKNPKVTLQKKNQKKHYFFLI